MPDVALIQCRRYALDELKDKIRQSLFLISFDEKRFADARVVVKPNLLMPAKEEKAIITNATFFQAVVQIVKENRGTPVLLESPAIHSLSLVIKKTAYASVVEAEQLEVADPVPTRSLFFDRAKKFPHLDISAAYFDADIILNLPKFKTHGITYITGAVKLLFGAIPGVEKSKMHLRAPAHDDFAEYLLDLYGAMTYGMTPSVPIIHIMDAICVQEGEGPGPAGKPRWLNAILAGDNGIAVDCVAAQLAGLDISKALTVVNGFKRDYGISSAAQINVTGDKVADLRVDDFKPATGASIRSNMFRWPLNTPTFKNWFLDRPVPMEDRCTLCYQCKKICASGAISVSDGQKQVPRYDYKKCIRCYCCLEICPEAAIRKEPGRFSWILGG